MKPPSFGIALTAALVFSVGACDLGRTFTEGLGTASLDLGQVGVALSADAAPETLSLSLDLEGQTFRLDLEQLVVPTSPNYQTFTLRRDGGLVVVPSSFSGCVYRGRAESLAADSAGTSTPGGWAVLDACSGPTPHPLGQALRGVLLASGKFWRIEPDASDIDGSDGVAHWAQPLRRRDTPGLLPETPVHTALRQQPESLAPPRLEFREGTPLETKYIDLVVVNDAARAANVGGLLESDTVLFVAAMNALLADSGLVPPLRVTLRAQVAFEADPYVPNFSGSEVDHDSLLAEFLDWANTEDSLPDHDEHLLLSGLDFLGDAAGYAGLAVACTSNSNGFIVQADDTGGGFAVVSAVHEMGHTLGMDHDDGNPCSEHGFIMAAVGCANCPMDGAEFSSCSVAQFGDYLEGAAYAEGALCADDVPPAPGVRSCGDAVVSEGESCDCGSEDCSGIDPCCNGSICQLDAGAECSDFNDSCCQACQVVAAAPEVVCRSRRSPCDFDEACTGLSKDCPADTFLPAGGACQDTRGNTGACYFGDCRSRGTQCEQIAEQQGAGFEGVGAPGPDCGLACDQVVCGDARSGCSIINGPTVLDGVACAGGGQCVDQQCVALVDQCPNDPAKVVPGTCGCGAADSDGDADGTADCLDGCPSDAAKRAPGACGCGNSDADATPDCLDGCPEDVLSVSPPCGAARDASPPGGSNATLLRASARGGCSLDAPEAARSARSTSLLWLLFAALPFRLRRARGTRKGEPGHPHGSADRTLEHLVALAQKRLTEGSPPCEAQRVCSHGIAARFAVGRARAPIALILPSSRRATSLRASVILSRRARRSTRRRRRHNRSARRTRHPSCMSHRRTAR